MAVATRAPAPVAVAPVRIIPTDCMTAVVPADCMTAVVPADWNDKRTARVALLYAMDW